MSDDRSTTTPEAAVMDPYAVLQLHPSAHPMVVMRTFRVLAAMYHPDNRATGDRQKFEQVVNAYRMLSDPVRRAGYDRIDGASAGDVRAPSGAAPRRTNGTDERRLRLLILQTLYNNRRGSLAKPGLSLGVLADMTDTQIEDVQFSLWYLRGKKFIEVDDKDEAAITVTGVDYVEDNSALMEQVLSLPAPREALGEGERGDRPV